MFSLKNDLLKISIQKIGAELCEISSVNHGTQFMWDGNPTIWGSYAPNLFPIIGMLKDGIFKYNGKIYSPPKHGFVRHNKDMEIVKKSDNSITFRLVYNDDLLKIYPFKFEFFIRFQLLQNEIIIHHTVVNKDTKPIYFSLGGHPAFKCPVYNYESYSDYSLNFEKEETTKTHRLNLKTGLVTKKQKTVFTSAKSIQFDSNLFNNDALIFKHLKSKKVTLHSEKTGAILTVRYGDFPYLGLWAKPKANFVCIEPWLGITDNDDTNQDLTTKEGIVKLLANNEFNANYTIEIHPSHLV